MPVGRVADDHRLMELGDRVVVVTGGASGIGRALALAFGQAGAKGVVVADLDDAGATAVAAELSAAGTEALGVRCDVSVEAAHASAEAAASDGGGRRRGGREARRGRV